jgi:hypothetical protein
MPIIATVRRPTGCRRFNLADGAALFGSPLGTSGGESEGESGERGVRRPRCSSAVSVLVVAVAEGSPR